jgi:hypothetical protein
MRRRARRKQRTKKKGAEGESGVGTRKGEGMDKKDVGEKEEGEA